MKASIANDGMQADLNNFSSTTIDTCLSCLMVSAESNTSLDIPPIPLPPPHACWTQPQTHRLGMHIDLSRYLLPYIQLAPGSTTNSTTLSSLPFQTTLAYVDYVYPLLALHEVKGFCQVL